MLPEITPDIISFWMQRLTSYQRKLVKGRLMFELRLNWASVHTKIKSGFDEEERPTVLSIFSDYLQVSKTD